MATISELQSLLKCLDLTSLEGNDNEKSILTLVDKANWGCFDNFVAAVCVYPNFGELVRNKLNKSIKTAVVGGYFPSGQTTLQTKITELKTINETDVEEVDIVINRGALLACNYNVVYDEIAAMRNCIPKKTLKVILETGDISDPELIKKASEIAISAGADFIKTSTGKSHQGATLEAVEVMCAVIKNHFEKTGIKIGIKPSGGIREINEAVAYLNLVKSILGEVWIQPSLFRIGASTLYTNIVNQLKKLDA